MLKCQVCGHRWFPRTAKRPVCCPRCKSYFWDERREETKRVTGKLETLPSHAAPEVIRRHS
jgi:predicted Zn-ribbon and HTH transcriptional regulator